MANRIDPSAVETGLEEYDQLIDWMASRLSEKIRARQRRRRALGAASLAAATIAGIVLSVGPPSRHSHGPGTAEAPDLPGWQVGSSQPFAVVPSRYDDIVLVVFTSED